MGECMAVEKIVATEEEIQQVLKLVPQQEPFRFINRVVELSTLHCIGEYTFKEDEFFYKGHFPGKPITPGVIILEAMAQTGVVVLGIFVGLKNGAYQQNFTTLFTEANVEFHHVVLPNTKITIKGELEIFRRNKIRSKVEVFNEEQKLVAAGILSGLGVELK